MNPPDWKCCTVEQLWRYVAWHLENAGIGSVLVGGAAVAIHTEGRYRTSNLDLVPDDLMRRKVPEILHSLGFAAQRNRNFAHPECPHLTIRLPMGPVEIGGEFPIVPDEIEVEGRRLRILSPIDCVKDRLVGYAHQGSRTYFDQAVLVCIHQPARVDLGLIEHWCEGNASMGAFKELKRCLMDIENERFFPGLSPQTKPRLTISLFARELLSARRILTRLGFERLKSPLLTHVLVTIEDGTMTLAVTDGVHWLESRIESAAAAEANMRFLMPAQALRDAARSGTGKLVLLNFSDGPGKPALLITICGRSTQTRTIYPTEPADGFPDRPVVEGRTTPLPKETMQALQTVACCAATDPIRTILNGVLFSPEDGGVLVATDGHHLACAPARVPDCPFVLPNAAVHVLGHPDFVSRDFEILWPDDPAVSPIQIRSGLHTLIAKSINGNYPDYRTVIPDCLPASATIPEIHRGPLVARLRSLTGPATRVRLTWDRPGHLTITQQDPDATPVSFEVPVTVEGHPATIRLRPQPLANALMLGSTIWLCDDLTPCLVTDPSGNFCVLMPVRSFQ